MPNKFRNYSNYIGLKPIGMMLNDDYSIEKDYQKLIKRIKDEERKERQLFSSENRVLTEYENYNMFEIDTSEECPFKNKKDILMDV